MRPRVQVPVLHCPGMAGQAGKGSEGPAPTAGALVRRGRQEIAWVPDHDLPSLEHREPATAAGLGLLCGGGGNLYVGDTKAGVTGIAAWVAALGAMAILPAGIAALPLFGVMGWGALTGYLKARSINSYIVNQLHADAARSGHDPSHKLLSAMNPAAAPAAPAQTTASPALLPADTPSEVSALIDRLNKLATLRASDVIDETEHRSRKIDAFSESATGLSAAETEALLFALVPLLDTGAITQEDIDFVKEMGS